MDAVALGNDHSVALVKGQVYRWGLCTRSGAQSPQSDKAVKRGLPKA